LINVTRTTSWVIPDRRTTASQPICSLDAPTNYRNTQRGARGSATFRFGPTLCNLI